MKSPDKNKKLVGYIDVTPTWKSLVPALVALIEGGNEKGRQVAIEEITRLAEIADDLIENRKKNEADPRK